ncbi:MAG TPA: aminotransferase class I/II-fold pyridoxal phosphate-dependent enzyme [Clostridiaceae bacterium]|nr:aminotransferase class I/II-fold pyridoxal phosphate-dependent enzyme [Clostridiaceae bacterium]
MQISVNTLNAPIYKAIKSYIEELPIPFHMPGHKMGKGLPQDWIALAGKIDLTEIFGLDNLHFPAGAIKEAQELAASAFGAFKTYFLVNGSSVGIHAAIMTVCNPGDKIIVARDCHRSVISGVILAGANPVYVPVEIDEDFGIPTTINTEILTEILEKNRDARAVLITRPNYYGICSDIEKIAEITRSFGKILIVDEAHGAHFKFHDSLPRPSLEAGADICIQSAHKTLPALTQSAYLHLSKDFSDSIDVERLEFNLRLLQTTSPSYLLMSSLDIARAIMEQHGKELLESLINKIDWFSSHISELKGIKILCEEDIRKNMRKDAKKDYKLGSRATELRNSAVGLKNPATARSAIHDKTRLVINISDLNNAGYDVEKFLREKFHIQVEMSDLFNIICITTVSDEKKDFEGLLKALKDIRDLKTHKNLTKYENLTKHGFVSTQKVSEKNNLIKLVKNNLTIPEQGMEPWKILSRKSEYIPFKTSLGRISRDFIVPYPPGVPLVCPGEIINRDIIEYVYKVLEVGGNVNGILQENGLKISVVL